MELPAMPLPPVEPVLATALAAAAAPPVLWPADEVDEELGMVRVLWGNVAVPELMLEPPVVVLEAGPEAPEAPELVRLFKPPWPSVRDGCLDGSNVMCRPCVW